MGVHSLPFDTFVEGYSDDYFGGGLFALAVEEKGLLVYDQTRFIGYVDQHFFHDFMQRVTAAATNEQAPFARGDAVA
jgi:hypothetical protein